MTTLMTKNDFATMMGVDKTQPTRWAALGMPVMPDGRVDGPRAATWVRAFVDSSQRNRRSNGARAIRAGEAMRADDAVDDLVRCGIRLAVSMVPTLAAEIAREARLSARQVHQLEAIARKRAPRIEVAVRELMGIDPNNEAEPMVEVLPLAIDMPTAGNAAG